MLSDKRVLITGASGRVGSALRYGLRDRCPLRLFDRVRTDDLGDSEEFVLGDVRDYESLARAAEGCAAIVHLAGLTVKEEHEALLDVNGRGTFHALRAAVDNEVERFIFASTNHVVGYYPVDVIVGPESPPRPDSLYAASKGYGELLCRLFHDRHALEVAIIRIGSVLVEPLLPRHAFTWISGRDLAELVWRCLVVESLDWAVLYGSGQSGLGYWDDRTVRARLEFTPRDVAPPRVGVGPDHFHGEGPSFVSPAVSSEVRSPGETVTRDSPS